MLEKLFNSRLRAKALGWMLTHPNERFCVRHLTQLIGEDSANLSRELIRLANMGILTCRRGGMKTDKADIPRIVCSEALF